MRSYAVAGAIRYVRSVSEFVPPPILNRRMTSCVACVTMTTVGNWKEDSMRKLNIHLLYGVLQVDRLGSR